MAAPHRLRLPDAELSHPTLVLARRFVQRWDIGAVQLDDGRCVCAPAHLDVEYLFSHLHGDTTLGTYVLDNQGRARFIVFDADDAERFSSLVDMARTLDVEDVRACLETSRRGGHLWLSFDRPVPGRQTRAFGRTLREKQGLSEVELCPKQDQLDKGSGSRI